MSIARAVVFLLALSACTPPPSASSSAADAAAAGVCTREGDQCQFSPGKIGLCTAKPGCQGDGCLSCMSLH